MQCLQVSSGLRIFFFQCCGFPFVPFCVLFLKYVCPCRKNNDQEPTGALRNKAYEDLESNHAAVLSLKEDTLDKVC